MKTKNIRVPLFWIYRSLKSLGSQSFLIMIERPKLYRQLAPEKYEEVINGRESIQVSNWLR